MGQVSGGFSGLGGPNAIAVFNTARPDPSSPPGTLNPISPAIKIFYGSGGAGIFDFQTTNSQTIYNYPPAYTCPTYGFSNNNRCSRAGGRANIGRNCPIPGDFAFNRSGGGCYCLIPRPQMPADAIAQVARGGGGGAQGGNAVRPNGSSGPTRGGGGGGGGGRGNAGNAGGCGGGGGCGVAGTPATFNCVPVTPGCTAPITVGSPGGQIVISWNPQ
jgi:hypothetical protein